VIPGAPLRIDQVSKRYGPVTAVKDVNLEITAAHVYCAGRWAVAPCTALGKVLLAHHP